MRHLATARFWRCYHALPKSVRELADRSFAQLKADLAHRSLHFKKVGNFRSARVGLYYRALAQEVDQDLAWFWIGTHAEYDTLLSQRPAKRLQPTAARRPAKKRTPRRRG